MSWRDAPIVDDSIPEGGTGVAAPPPQQGWKISQADQAQRDLARRVIIERELADNPNDAALQREVAAERRKQGAAAPVSISWRDAPIVEQPKVQPKDPLADTMRQQTAEGGVANAFNTGIANAATRLAAGVGSLLPNAVAKYLPTQHDVDLLEAGSEGSVPARAGQLAMDVTASAVPAAGVFNAVRGMRTAPYLVPGVTPALSARVAPAVLPAIAGETAVNAGYGALTADEGERGTGAAWGAGGTLAGHALGGTLAKMRAGAKPTDDALQFQAKMRQVHGGSPPPGVLTPGQLAPEGGWLRKLEESLADVPLVGSPLRKRQEDAMRGFQEWSRTLAKPPSSPGSSASTIADLKQAFNEAYEGALRDQRIGDVSAVGMHEMEKSIRREAGKFLKSPDPEQVKQGMAMLERANEFRRQWRSMLPQDTQEMLSAIDARYADFIPIKEASKRQNVTLVNPENYTPAMVLGRTRNIPNNEQSIFARQAERAIGSIPARTTTAGNIGLGGITIASLLGGVAPHAAVGAGLAAAYGTKTGQKVARGLQRGLTGEEATYIARALRRGAAPAAVQADEQ